LRIIIIKWKFYALLDAFGTDERELWEHIQTENLATAAYKLAALIRKITESTTGKIILHRTSKIILKRKKDFVETWKNVRPITIMPAIYMEEDKITNAYLKNKLQPLIYNHQHGARSGMSTATAKMNLLYTLNKEQFKCNLLLDLQKVFDLVNRNKLIQNINITIKDQNDRKLLLLIQESYKYVNISIIDTIIHPQRGILQGTV